MIDKWARSLIGASLAGALISTSAFAEPDTARPDAASQHDAPRSGPDPLTPPDASNAPPPLAPGAPVSSAPAPTSTTAATQPAQPVLDPILVQVRARLAEPRDLGKGDDRADVAAVKTYYSGSSAKLMWTGKDGLNERGRKVVEEISKADDWGLEASAFDLSQSPSSGSSETALAESELKISLAVLKYARFARGGRIDPTSFTQISEKSERIYFDEKPRVYEPKSVLEAIAAAPEVDAYLQNLHPKHEGFKRLREALLKLKGAQDAPAGEAKIPKGPTLKAGEQNEQVALVRKRLAVAAEAGQENLLDPALVDAIKAYQRKEGLKETGQIDAKLRSSLNGPDVENVEQQRLRILANMERWRWVTDDLGNFYVWDNIPEQITRVISDGKILLNERIVVGKPSSPTPVFSARMQFIVFHPEWGVPDSIKANELGPKLRSASGGGFHRRSSGEMDDWFGFGGGDREEYAPSGSSRVLQSYGLRVSYNGHDVDPDSIDWANVDIKKYQFIQPAGGKNVLGVVKFRFPNKHDVYMHDTTDKQLFSNFPRAYSHGCMRTQNPVHLAEVLLEHDKGWSAAKVRSIVSEETGAPEEIQLTTTIPVHITYFTASADGDGKVVFHPDIYGLDGKIASILAKRTVRFNSQLSDADEKEPQKSQRASTAAEPRSRRREAEQSRRFFGPDD